MNKINILDSTIFNRIAAGEVVERPASVVKELVENSIDANADNIIIEIIDGGIKKIKITDNGKGIEEDDIKLAFLPHATSKIYTIDDLNSIETLGFRGEALASIAAVSQVSLISKTKDADYGIKIEINGGVFGEKIETASQTGTQITVENLFYNIPARAKFLKKPKSEEVEITNLVTRLMLANPDIKFKYLINGKIVFQSFGERNLINAVQTIYGTEIASELIPVNFNRNNIHIHGYIGRPEIAKSNRTFQTLIINKRYVVSYLISSAVQSAYDDFLMKGKFPFFVLNIDLPYDQVDVNVHPNKLEVRFENTRDIYGMINTCCYNCLVNTDFSRYSNTLQNEKNLMMPELKLQTINEGVSFKNNNQTDFKHIENLLDSKTPQDKMTFDRKSSMLSEIILSVSNNQQEFPKPLDLKQEVLFNENDEKTNFEIVGVAFKTYIIIQKQENLYFIDQHAAHERQIYDKLTSQLENNSLTTQKLLIPFILNLSSQEFSFMNDNLNSFTELGFQITEFGRDSFKIEEIPLCLTDINLKEYFENILKEITSYLKKPLNIIKQFLKTTACKAAVKGGDSLMKNEIESLINRLEEEKTTLLCPHGRPIVIKIRKNEIEKWFKRIV